MPGSLLDARGPTAEQLMALLAELAAETGDDAAGPTVSRMLRRVCPMLGAAGAAVHLVDARGERLGVCERVTIAHGADPAVAAAEQGQELWSAALVAIPIAGAAGQHGGLALWFDAQGPEHAFAPAVRSFLLAFGLVLTLEVERACLRDRERAAERARDKVARWSTVLAGAFRLLSSRGSLDRALDELVRNSCETPGDFAAIRLLSPDRQSLVYRALYHRDPVQNQLVHETLHGQSVSADLGDTAHLLASGESILIPKVDMERLLRMYRGTSFGDYVERFPVASVIAVPLRSRATIFGALIVARTTTPEPFQPADLHFLEEIAACATAAFDNADLLQTVSHSEEKLRVAVEAGRLGAWEWDITSGRVSWSPTLEQIHGFAVGTFPGTFEAYQGDVHPEDRDRVLDAIRRTIDERIDYHVVYRIIRPDGDMRWLETHGRLLYDLVGAPQRLVGVCSDITERKRGDEQLRHTLLALEDANRRKDEYLAMLAHELRNPLGPMLNTTHLLGMPGLPAEQARGAHQVLERQVRHMSRLLDDLLDVSRIARGKIELSREPVDVSALAREVAADHAESFRAAGLALHVTVDAEPLDVHADRTRLAQVIGNLLSNALKFSKRGQEVVLRATRDHAREQVVITVGDGGAGIEPALLESIFEPFVQADKSLSRSRGGLGLGLAVVKGLVEQHGGRVSASSAGLGRGAELRVELPHYTGPDRRSAPTTAKPAASPRPSAAILVFEDNEDAAETLQLLLSSVGYAVSVELTGGNALDVVRKVRPDLVLCDIGLPGRDGYSIAQDIRATPELARTPLIAMSGYGSGEDKERARRAGFDLHLTKPVPIPLLLEEVARRLTSSVAGLEAERILELGE